LLILTDAGLNIWQRRWFVLRRFVRVFHLSCAHINHPRRPQLYIYAHSNEVDEVGVISLSGSGVKVEHNSDMDSLFDVRALSTVLSPN